MPIYEIERAGKRGALPTKQKKDFSKMQSTLLLFTAPWADNCYFTYPLWVRFANRFTSQKMKFVEIDCAGSRFDSIARAFKINLSNVGNQLPSLVLLEDGAEYLRFPPVDKDTGKTARVLDYKEKELIKYFDLDNRFLATQDAGL